MYDILEDSANLDSSDSDADNGDVESCDQDSPEKVEKSNRSRTRNAIK